MLLLAFCCAKLTSNPEPGSSSASQSTCPYKAAPLNLIPFIVVRCNGVVAQRSVPKFGCGEAHISRFMAARESSPSSCRARAPATRLAAALSRVVAAV